MKKFPTSTKHLPHIDPQTFYLLPKYFEIPEIPRNISEHISHISTFWYSKTSTFLEKTGAEHEKGSRNKILNIFDMRSTSTRKHEMKFGNEAKKLRNCCQWKDSEILKCSKTYNI